MTDVAAVVRLRNVQVDVPADAFDGAAAFWAAALDASTRPGQGPYTHLVGARSPVGLHLQRLDAGTGRVHLDLEADDIPAAADRLLGLGATRLGDGEAGPVLQDPGGHVLCVCPAGLAVDLGTVDGPGARLHVVVLDTARDAVAATADFWAAALGVTARPLDAPYDAYTYLADVPVPGGGLAMLVQDVGADTSPRIHLDLHVRHMAERDAEVARLVGLGAEVVDDSHRWVVLRDPVGLLVCVVPDPPS